MAEPQRRGAIAILVAFLLATPATAGASETEVAGPVAVGLLSHNGVLWSGRNASSDPNDITLVCTDQDGTVVRVATFTAVPPGQSRNSFISREAAGVGSQITCVATGSDAIATTLSTLDRLFDPIETVSGRSQ